VGRRTTAGMGALASFMIGTVALGGLNLGAGSTTSPGAPEFHAPRIPGPAPIRSGARSVFDNWTSANWSGYALTGTRINEVVGNWIVPQVVAPNKKRQLKTYRYSSSWVGIDGFDNASLIQAGTEQDWLHGSKFYQAWWEILPLPEQPIMTITVHPGDAMSVSITESGSSDIWTIVVTDTTTAQSFSTVQWYAGPRESAEWIQEAPTIGRRVATLATDSNVVFDLGRLDSPPANPRLISAEAGAMFKGRVQISTPSAPNPNGDGFAVAYGRVAPPAPSS